MSSSQFGELEGYPRDRKDSVGSLNGNLYPPSNYSSHENQIRANLIKLESKLRFFSEQVNFADSQSIESGNSLSPPLEKLVGNTKTIKQETEMIVRETERMFKEWEIDEHHRGKGGKRLTFQKIKSNFDRQVDVYLHSKTQLDNLCNRLVITRPVSLSSSFNSLYQLPSVTFPSNGARRVSGGREFNHDNNRMNILGDDDENADALLNIDPAGRELVDELTLNLDRGVPLSTQNELGDGTNKFGQNSPLSQYDDSRSMQSSTTVASLSSSPIPGIYTTNTLGGGGSEDWDRDREIGIDEYYSQECGINKDGRSIDKFLEDDYDDDDEIAGLLGGRGRTSSSGYWGVEQQKQNGDIQLYISKERLHGVEKIRSQLSQAASVFKELAHLIDEQQDDLDILDSSITGSQLDTGKAIDELTKAHKIKQRARKRKCFFTFVTVLVALTIILAFGLPSTTSSSTFANPPSPTQPKAHSLEAPPLLPQALAKSLDGIPLAALSGVQASKSKIKDVEPASKLSSNKQNIQANNKKGSVSGIDRQNIPSHLLKKLDLEG